VLVQKMKKKKKPRCRSSDEGTHWGEVKEVIIVTDDDPSVPLPTELLARRNHCVVYFLGHLWLWALLWPTFQFIMVLLLLDVSVWLHFKVSFGCCVRPGSSPQGNLVLSPHPARKPAKISK
jgi:hypothetical protein